jgi:hypothetical protein
VSQLDIRALVVRVLYALAEQRIGNGARRCVAAFTSARGVHLVMP